MRPQGRAKGRDDGSLVNPDTAMVKIKQIGKKFHETPPIITQAFVF
jgi:hypothetical protein